MRRNAGLSNVRLHDLRRTLRTGLAELGVSFEVAERVLNHAMPGCRRSIIDTVTQPRNAPHWCYGRITFFPWRRNAKLR